MKALFAFIKKEWLDAIRSGRIITLTILFALLGIMSPAIAKLTPWMMKLMTDSLAESGIIITDVSVNALTSWTQFFKNIPIGLIAFVLIYSNTFTKEYQSGTLILMLTRGLSRYQAVLAKSTVMLSLYSFCYWLCFAVTYLYNSYFWNNRIVTGLFPVAAHWWLFGVWLISLLVFFSMLFSNNTGVLLGTGITVLAAYLAGLFPDIQGYMPTTLMNAASLLSSATGFEPYTKAVIITAALSVAGIAMGAAGKLPPRWAG